MSNKQMNIYYWNGMAVLSREFLWNENKSALLSL